MASGKSTVGQSVARRLGWDFVDVDEAVVEREGRSVAAIFAEDGEARFRRLEAEATSWALARDHVVVAPGGGWAAAGFDRLDEVPPGTLTVWLRVDPATAVMRAAASGTVRPLLEGSDAQATASALSAERAPFYARARLHVDTVGVSPDAVADTIVRAVGAASPES